MKFKTSDQLKKIGGLISEPPSFVEGNHQTLNERQITFLWGNLSPSRSGSSAFRLMAIQRAENTTPEYKRQKRATSCRSAMKSPFVGPSLAPLQPIPSPSLDLAPLEELSMLLSIRNPEASKGLTGSKKNLSFA